MRIVLVVAVIAIGASNPASAQSKEHTVPNSPGSGEALLMAQGNTVGYRVRSTEVPEGAVAVPLEDVLHVHTSAELSQAEVIFGHWRDGEHNLPPFQDIVVATR